MPRPKWQNWAIKITVLCFSCLLGFGSYFCYDSPAALQSEIKHAMNLTQAEFMSLYAWYSWPNVFLCFIGGYLIDAVLGKRWGGITFASLVLVGQLALALGMRKKSLLMMDIGRLIFGLGGETLAVVGNAYSVAWFTGSMLNLAFGAVLSVSRLGSTASLNALEPLYEYLKKKGPEIPENIILSNVLATAAVLCLFSLIVAVILGSLDWGLYESTVLHEHRSEVSSDDENPLLEEGDQSGELISQEEPDEIALDLDSELSWKQKLTKSLSFSPGTWLLFAICVFFYSSVFPLISQGVEFFEKWFNVDPAVKRYILSHQIFNGNNFGRLIN